MGTYHNDDDFLLREYFSDITDFGLIDTEEENRLAGRIAKGDIQAREKMILSNLRLVVKISQGFEDFGLPTMDLISEGNIGLMRAVESFDPKKGAKFSTYAAWWIKQRIKRALSDTGSTIRIPVHKVDDISRMNKFIASYVSTNGTEPSDEEIESGTGLDPIKIRQANNIRRCLNIDQPLDEFGGSTDTLGDTIPDPNANTSYDDVDRCDQIQILGELVKDLNERERKIIEMRFGLNDDDPMTLGQIGERFGLTRERIRQLEDVALKKLRRRIQRRNS